MPAVLTLNSGSSSIKFAVYVPGSGGLDEIASGQVDALGPAAKLILETQNEKTSTEIGEADHVAGLRAVLDALRPVLGETHITGVGHRIVHGGTKYAEPIRLDETLLEELDELSHLAPLHQPPNLTGVRAAMTAFPDAIQVGCFDTGFHRGHPFENDTYALPKRFYEEGIRRYGFHGLSYDYVSGYVEGHHPDLKDARIIIAHLGNGCSMCCVKGRAPIASTLGFSSMDGLPMGTRCGQLDPGVVFHLMAQGMTADEVHMLLIKEAGLKGMSGISNDMRELLASDSPDAANALSYYVSRIRREIGSLTAANGGLDALVFTGGIGENAWQIRERVCEGMAFFGIAIDPAANEANREIISTSRTKVLVVNTNEQLVIARAIINLL
ncbi:acetate/propionate family kinase [Pseudovibrio exalbescens]|uniref:acetate/propionate family kinase n=1 Tax=Pseudovibrio exalbescens TaxID=197461 RepID=UPI0023651AFD|nr:acetate/propionate family kinase [Pseudovibrio exalbescens]MDD7909834.1 acetate/propionate family kinase [Pseudovibrio exalbescens]